MNSITQRLITLHQPRTLVFGAGAIEQCAQDLAARRFGRRFIVTSPPTRSLCRPLQSDGTVIWDGVSQEPTIQTFLDALAAARQARADVVIGLGGGSAMDVAKLVAAFVDSQQDIRDAFGIGKLAGRSTGLVCLPTTSGTGSEVSPNAILLDETDQLKKGVISPHLMPDAAYVDPALTLSVPPAVTASTGMDALTHCIEAYANRLAHPMIDLYALQGVRLIAQNLARAVEHGNDLEARTNLALGSLYGGIVLGPVNTGAVHALAYPLGGEFHVAHGVSNAVLLPHVLEFNLPAAPDRYADIAIALGAQRGGDDLETARRGLEIIKDLSRRCAIPSRLSELNIPRDAIERMARAAMTVTRLLERNVRPLTLDDAIEIYRSAF
ncbi:iron-containing alcohol dehydrogenase [Fontivita pretiosa]|uniref:iron-containing alcohol dehydrogenase n=1 Tax=Fontivita pretiosa TaxID=2989684 RepID=UPI003D168C0B